MNQPWRFSRLPLCSLGLLAILVLLVPLVGCGKSNSSGRGATESSNPSNPATPSQQPDGQPADTTAEPTKSGQQVKSDLKQIALAMQNFNATYGCLSSPGPFTVPTAPEELDAKQIPWRVALLPFMEQGQVINDIMKGKYKGGKNGLEYWLNPELAKVSIPMYASSPNSSLTRYRIFVGNGAAFEPGQNMKIPASFKDGTSNTILVVEAGEAVPWLSDKELPYDPQKPLPKLGHPSRDVFYAAMADGSVREIPKNTEEKVLRALITRAGGEWVNLPGK
ncbi:MAG TPA: DUF1559 domain-containing protein [Gemmataceae bacterium]|jgi:hypothetical protein